MKIIRRQLPEGVEPLKSVPEFLSKIYLSRGIKSDQELELKLQSLCSPSTMAGVDEAVKLVFDAVKHNRRILIVGDFDCDGATSTALSVLVLRRLGAVYVDYIVPNRFEFGYGLTPEIVDFAYAEKSPDLIITVDNGIASVEGVKRAKAYNIKVLVTDHHLPGNEVPNADAVVNPNQNGCDFPSKSAAGVGVVFYVLSCLKTFMKESGWFAETGLQDFNMSEYLDLVALGTVADLVPLDRNNRILVSQGLKRMKAGRCRPGIQALMELSGRKITQVKTSDMGFIVGPRLNAAGRLDDMSVGIECLLADDINDAFALGAKLEQLNTERKQIESEMKLDAEVQLEKLLEAFKPDGQEFSWWGISLYEPHWHQGVVGILASRVKEQCHKPVIAFAPESDDPDCQIIKGSARSIPGLHMRDALDLVSKRYEGLLLKFGGHAMAAGLSLQLERFSEFQIAFDQVVKEMLSEEELEASLMTDGALSELDCNLYNIELLEQAGPWGQKFPEPCFDNYFEVLSSRVLKEKHLKLVVQFESRNGEIFDAIQFNSPHIHSQLPDKIRAVYRPNINEFRGRRSVQFMIDYIELDNESLS